MLGLTNIGSERGFFVESVSLANQILDNIAEFMSMPKRPKVFPPRGPLQPPKKKKGKPPDLWKRRTMRESCKT